MKNSALAKKSDLTANIAYFPYFHLNVGLLHVFILNNEKGMDNLKDLHITYCNKLQLVVVCLFVID